LKIQKPLFCFARESDLEEMVSRISSLRLGATMYRADFALMLGKASPFNYGLCRPSVRPSRASREIRLVTPPLPPATPPSGPLLYRYPPMVEDPLPGPVTDPDPSAQVELECSPGPSPGLVTSFLGLPRPAPVPLKVVSLQQGRLFKSGLFHSLVDCRGREVIDMSQDDGGD
jgi:hypothetical protein